MGELTHLVTLRNARTALEFKLLLDELGGRGSLGDEVKAAILIDADLDRNDVAGLVLRGGIESLAELHDIDLGGTKGRSDGRGRVGLAGGDLELYEVGDLLCGHSVFSLTVRLPLCDAAPRSNPHRYGTGANSLDGAT